MLELETIAGSERVPLAELVCAATRALLAAGVDTPRLDARLLASAATGCGTAELIAHPERLIDREAVDAFTRLVARRVAREPVSRILGEREFFGRAFAITPATLDPRSDSETLVEAALDFAQRRGSKHPLRILDIGTGSGALLVTLLCELPQATGVGTDVSPDALAVAADNARRHGVERRAGFHVRNALEGLAEPFDMVVCNPPYIATGEIAGLAPEVRDYDPRAALDGGADGLDMYEEIIPALASVLAAPGWAGFEVGAGQAATVAHMLHQAVTGGRLSSWKDLAGHQRCVATERQL